LLKKVIISELKYEIYAKSPGGTFFAFLNKFEQGCKRIKSAGNLLKVLFILSFNMPVLNVVLTGAAYLFRERHKYVSRGGTERVNTIQAALRLACLFNSYLIVSPVNLSGKASSRISAYL
jgi:hypothetical protein